tara:strand:+ start:6481 stop:6885 length:405 start_codon:yes stop_codon:yes gene_type:complete
MLFWKDRPHRPPYLKFCVSILILLDVVLEVLDGLNPRIPTVVSILILLDVVLEAYDLNVGEGFVLVSILILLDVVLEVFPWLRRQYRFCCFNPYSVGCCSGRVLWQSKGIDVPLFQSLFCWMLFWKFFNFFLVF